MAASNIPALQQRVNRSLNRETQYNFHEPFDVKEYHTAMITGHRWFDYNIPIDKLIKMAVKQGVTKFLCGMALGTDQVAAEILVRRKLKWTAVIPCADQHLLWKPREQSHYKKLLEQATDQVCLYKNYSPGVMQARNAWMVKRSDICLAVFSGDPHGVGGGTATTFEMARNHNLLIYQYVPAESQFLIVEPAHRQLRLF
ncbi:MULTISPECIES: SLOG family protein [unclassified Microcoleus]|uniref:SLOG family protein n=1 Tax=unclassified Microcoleus TaxID=2642155 RepID=UPI002FCF9A1E